MNIIKIEENVKNIVAKVNGKELAQEDFIYELLLGYGHRPQTIGRVKSGERNLADDKVNSVFWKRQIYFQIAEEQNLYDLIDQMKNEKRVETNKIRFLIVTDFQKLLAVDLKTQDPLDINFIDLPKKFDFFLPWAQMEKAVYQGEHPADVKAADKLAKLFDEIKTDNFDGMASTDKNKLHQLNMFLSRLLFCYFAEDTGIFKDKQFTSIIIRTKEDGSDLSHQLERLFQVLDQPENMRVDELPGYLNDFPYVNGGLFKDDILVPIFTKKSRRILIECGAELDWSDINPDIFGSMFQAVVHSEQRSNMGQHYTSVPNIMKVIEPLFLNDLYDELEKNQNSIKKLLELQLTLEKLIFFDPACGSGNFLIISYKELRKFEMELLKRIQELELQESGQFTKPFSVIQISQFYGLEIDRFATDIAILSLWLAEHQMNLSFKDELGESIPSLPLKAGGKIIAENASLLDWEHYLSLELKASSFTYYIIGNPPYRGARQQDENQKKEVEIVLEGINSFKNLDYIAIWFYKAAEIIGKYPSVSGAFVSTNSITQGTQVGLLWPEIFKKSVDITFCHTSFKWVNNAKDNAGVVCVVIGLHNRYKNKKKYIFDSETGNRKTVIEINPYLTEGRFILIEQRKKTLSDALLPINYGSFALDDGNLTLSKDEAQELISLYPDSGRFIKRFIGAKELLQGQERFCLWINENNKDAILPYQLINERVGRVRSWRAKSSRKLTANLADVPYMFAEIRQPNSQYLAFPTISSERREYIPSQYFSSDVIASNQIYIIPDAPIWLFSILGSSMHMAWVRSIGGRLKTDIRYSSSLCYNTFPLPNISEKLMIDLELLGLELLIIREKFSDRSLAQLYDPKKMPEELRAAHLTIDHVVDKIFKHKGTLSDASRLETLLACYRNLTEN